MNVIERALEEPAKPKVSNTVEDENEQLPLIGRSIAMPRYLSHHCTRYENGPLRYDPR